MKKFLFYKNELENIQNTFTDCKSKYHRLFEDAAIGIFHSTFEGRFLDLNPALVQMLGYDSPEQVINTIQNIADEIYAEPPYRDQGITEMLLQGKPLVAQNKYLRKDGSIWYGNLILRYIFDEQGNPEYLEGFVEDITERKQAQKALRESEEWLSALTEQSVEGISVSTMEGEYVYVNYAFCKMMGYSKKELLTMTVFDMKKNKTEEAKFNKSKSSKKGTLFNIELQRKDKSIFISEVSGKPIKIGNRSLVLGIVKDITKRKQIEQSLEKSERRFKAFFNNSPEGFIIWDKDLKYINVNPVLAKMNGLSVEDHINKTFQEILPELAEHLVPKLQKLLDSGKSLLEYESFDKTYRKDAFYWVGNFFPIMDNIGKVCEIACIIRDVSDTKKAENNLLIAKRHAEDANRLKTAFLSNMSHEIRTPLNAIIGYTDLTLQNELESEQRENLETIRSSGLLLLNLISDILDLSKIESGQTEIENITFSIKDVFNKIGATARILIASKEKKIELKERLSNEIAEYIVGDEYKLHQILNNLINNSCKFTISGTIEYGAKLKNKHTLELYVKDTGKGIAKRKRNEIFKPFRQEDISDTRNYGGTGLGLTISKKLVELMGGSIRLDSKMGNNHGTIFYINLPYKPGKRKKSSNKIRLSHTPEIKTENKILLVEDDLVSRMMIKKMLEISGFSVILASNGKDAIDEYTKKTSLDLIIMDVQMPIKTGLEAVTEIRKLEKKDSIIDPIPIIMLSAAAMESDREKAIKSGANGYLTKPVTLQDLVSKITQYL